MTEISLYIYAHSILHNRSDQASQERLQIFTGLSIHINGYTSPPSSELRRMILQHGGDYQHYCKKIGTAFFLI